MAWDGTERRKETRMQMEEIKKQLLTIEIAIAGMTSSLQNYHSNLRSYRDEIEKDINKHSETLYGNGHPGLTSRVRSMENIQGELTEHKKVDTKWFVTICGLLITILGWTIFKK